MPRQACPVVLGFFLPVCCTKLVLHMLCQNVHLPQMFYSVQHSSLGAQRPEACTILSFSQFQFNKQRSCCPCLGTLRCGLSFVTNNFAHKFVNRCTRIEHSMSISIKLLPQVWQGSERTTQSKLADWNLEALAHFQRQLIVCAICCKAPNT